MSVPISYSFKDLLLHPLFKMAAKQDDKELMKQCFWEMGIDTSKPYEIVNCLHRSRLDNTPWQGDMVAGLERLDKEWLQSEYASYEAKIYTDNVFLKGELDSLDPSKRSHRHVAEEDIDWDADDGDFEDWSREEDVAGSDEGDCV